MLKTADSKEIRQRRRVERACRHARWTPQNFPHVTIEHWGRAAARAAVAILRLLGVCPVIVPMRADEALPHLVRVVPLQPFHLAKIARRCSDDPLPAPWPGGQRAKICGLKYFPT